jgi:hypothetical protein
LYEKLDVRCLEAWYRLLDGMLIPPSAQLALLRKCQFGEGDEFTRLKMLLHAKVTRMMSGNECEKALEEINKSGMGQCIEAVRCSSFLNVSLIIN